MFPPPRPCSAAYACTVCYTARHGSLKRRLRGERRGQGSHLLRRVRDERRQPRRRRRRQRRRERISTSQAGRRAEAAVDLLRAGHGRPRGGRRRRRPGRWLLLQKRLPLHDSSRDLRHVSKTYSWHDFYNMSNLSPSKLISSLSLFVRVRLI